MPQSGDSTRSVLVSGSTGLIGSALCEEMRVRGWQVLRLVRRAPRSDDERPWDPSAGRVGPEVFDGVDALVHLAGEPIMGVWTAAKMARIRRSRVEGTRALAEAIARAPARPGVLVSASATGYYGDRGDAVLTESSEPGDGFLADVCVDWEGACEPTREAGVRTVHPRIGMVLSRRGGALQAMLPIYRLGLGGPVGSGDQWVSWIALADVVGVLARLIDDERIEGPVNCVAPEPVPNAAFARALGRAMHKPTLLGLPAAAAKLLAGPMAREVLLASARVRPHRLEELDHPFALPALDEALQAVLSETAAPAGRG